LAASLGDLLVEAGMITQEELRAASAYSKKTNTSLSLSVVELGFCDPADLSRAISSGLGVELLGPADLAGISDQEVSLITSEMAKEFRSVPVRAGKSRLLLAISDPTDIKALEEVSQFTNLTVVPGVASEADISAALYYYYSIGSPPPESGPMAIAWKPGHLGLNTPRTGKVHPGQPAMLTPKPVELGVRMKLPRHEPLNLDDIPALEPRPSVFPVSRPKVASPMTNDTKSKYSSLDWWLGRTDEPEIVVRTPKGLNRPHKEDEDDLLLLAPITKSGRTTKELVKTNAQPKRAITATFGYSAPGPAEPWQADPMLEELAASFDRKQIVELALQYMLQSWARAAFFVVRRKTIIGLDGKGENIDSHTIRTMMVPLNAPSLFMQAYELRKSYVGSPLDSNIDNMCFKALGARPNMLAIAPLTIHDGSVVAFLYADSGASNKSSPGDPKLEILRLSVVNALSNLLKKAKEEIR